jgi:GntR family transcriptional regulator, transcriptional repressor for pyruvate dehydrogenase complex
MMAELRRVERVERSHPAFEVARQLLDHLLNSRDIAVGERLPSERALAETFGVGRSAVREALKSLSLLGLLEIRQGDGTYLRNDTSTLLPQVIQWGLLLDRQSITDLMDARRAVEVGLAELAALRRTDEDLRLVGEQLRGLEASIDDPPAWVSYDVGFHLQIARAAHSASLADVLFRLRTLLDASIRHNQAQNTDNQAKYHEHERIFEAVRDGDAAAAAAAMREHMDRVARRLLAGGPVAAVEAQP